MTASLQPIILGGGIQAGTPFSLRAIPLISVVTPPTIADSIMFQTAAGDIIVGPVDPAPAATEALRTAGGFVSDTGVGHDNVVAGRAAVAALRVNGRNVVLGTSARADASGGGFTANVSLNVVIGNNASLNQGVGSCVIIGSNFIMGGSFPGGNLVAIGNSVNVDVAFTGPAVGQGFVGRGRGCGLGNQGGAAGNFNNWVTLGFAAIANANNATVLGDGARVNHATSIAIGRNAVSIGTNNFIVGGQNLDITTMLVGGGDLAAAPLGLLWRQTDGEGADIPGGNLTVRASLGTGAAATGGEIIFQTGTTIAAGVTLQTPSPRLAVMIPSTNGAAVDFRTVTTGAGAAVGTLTNAPTAGNPAFWLPIRIAGVVHYLPAWV